MTDYAGAIYDVPSQEGFQAAAGFMLDPAIGFGKGQPSPVDLLEINIVLQTPQPATVRDGSLVSSALGNVPPTVVNELDTFGAYGTAVALRAIQRDVSLALGTPDAHISHNIPAVDTRAQCSSLISLPGLFKRTLTPWFKMRALDSSLPPNNPYLVWIVQDTPDFTGSRAPAHGTLSDFAIADEWEQ